MCVCVCVNTNINVILICRGTFRRIVKHRSTEEFESFPYISTLLSSTLWTYYGITKPGSYLVATVNGFGAVVQVIYLSLFLTFAPPRIKVINLLTQCHQNNNVIDAQLG